MHAANNVLTFLIHTLFTLYIGAIFIRLVLAAVRADFYNPISQFLVTITNPVLIPLRKILPSIGRIDTASWVLIFGLKALEIFILFAVRGLSVNVNALIMTTLIEVLSMIVTIFLYAIIIRAILSWFVGPNSNQNPAFSIIQSITEPLLRPARRLIPPVGMFDLSAFIMILLLYSVLIVIRSV